MIFMIMNIYALYEGIGLWFDDIAHLSTSLGRVGVIAFDWPCRRARMLVAWSS